MFLSPDNTQFFTFFSGIKNRELVALRRLAASFRQYYDAPLYVMDQHRPIQELIAKGERIYYADRAYVDHISSDLDIEGLEAFFRDNAEFVRRVPVTRQFQHSAFINEALTNHRSLPYAVVMDSDVWFKNSRFFADMNVLVAPYSNDDLVAAGYLYQSMPFELPSTHGHNKRWMHRLGEGLVRRFGFRERRGKLPGLEPNFLWVNGDLFVLLNMRFQNLHLNIFDTVVYNGANYKLLGDNGPSLLYQAAIAGKTIINVNINRWREHEKGVGQSTDRGEHLLDWFDLDSRDWPPSDSENIPRLGGTTIKAKLRHRAGRLARTIESRRRARSGP